MRVILAATLMVLSGCAAGVPALPPGSATGLESCGGTPIALLTGQPVSALPLTGDWGTLRVIRPGDAVTEDFSLQRLNVYLDAHDRIDRLSCG